MRATISLASPPVLGTVQPKKSPKHKPNLLTKYRTNFLVSSQAPVKHIIYSAPGVTKHESKCESIHPSTPGPESSRISNSPCVYLKVGSDIRVVGIIIANKQ